MFLSFRTDRFGQTVHTQIRLLLEEKEKPTCSTFREIRGVWNFRIFTAAWVLVLVKVYDYV